MYGEKVEEAEELRLDLQDVKEMYKSQVRDLLTRWVTAGGVMFLIVCVCVCLFVTVLVGLLFTVIAVVMKRSE